MVLLFHIIGENYLAAMANSSFLLLDLINAMTGQQLYRVSCQHPELLCLPSVEWEVHEYVVGTPFVCTAPMVDRRMCGERFRTLQGIEDHWWTHSRDMHVIVDDFFSIGKR